MKFSGHQFKYTASLYLFKVNNKNFRKRCEICLNLPIKTPERPRWRCSSVFIINFKHISHLFLVFLVFPSIFYYQQVNISWCSLSTWAIIFTFFYFIISRYCFLLNSLTHFMPLVSSYTPWKHKNQRFSDIFRGHRKRQVAQHGLKVNPE